MIKPGWQTSGFWLTVFSNVAAVGSVAAGVVPGPIGLGIAAATNVAYVAARTVVHTRQIKNEQDQNNTGNPRG